MAEQNEKADKKRPTLTPEQEAEAAKKKAARAESKAKGGKGKGGGANAQSVAEDRVHREGPARLRKLYDTEIRGKLKQEFGLANVMEVPRLDKVTINMGLGEAVTNPKLLDTAVEELGAITGQKPVVTKAKKSIAVFKLREGQPIGCRVTLRRDAMYEFFDRLIAAALPRIRDFRGLSIRSFDGRGNYSLGVNDQTIFPEIELDKIKRQQGMDITIVTSATSNDEALDLLKLMGMPFAENR